MSAKVYRIIPLCTHYARALFIYRNLLGRSLDPVAIPFPHPSFKPKQTELCGNVVMN
jgi:hypothetical protein